MKNKEFVAVLIVFGLTAFLFPLLTQAVTVGPIKLEYSVDPGDVISGEVFLFNEGKKTETFYPVFEKYTEVDGKKKFLTGESEIVQWFDLPFSKTLAANQQAKLPFTLRIPENAEPGGHFAVMWWGTAPPVKEGGEQVSITTRAGILIYLRVSGEVDESGQLVGFSTKDQKRIFSSRPISFDIIFESTGSVHLKPQGEVQIKNIFGRTKAVLEVNEDQAQVFPKNKRTFNVVWASLGADENKGGILGGLINEWQNFAFGFYKANLSLEYGEEVKEVKDSFVFFVIPWRILSLILIILFFLGLGFIKGLKKYNQWIIAKYQK
ncbi:MAG: hypothetical protein CO160_00155 [Candidatus Portnoybacteria bacterium CG_4_9_14_3_um_filter_43_11]|uniref:DUF916 domain-containing protein n=1 Tax=Candidatus Portnoybacteria bacterium CG_4_9_14_3_um_filter_43_11 TaxID=1974805 RepID=A0A2M7YMC8_9BACT|nr:MAG: hypothetical protein CO160_00155 [Candidatus Portnoybacteria bacterium CG_4_9_14_3_um_filter_43_11]